MKSSLSEIEGKLSAQTAAGKVATRIFEQVEKIARPGTNLLEIESLSASIIAESGMTASFKGFHGYPAATCLSINYEIVHGIPKDYKLKSGDVLKLDLGVTNDGWIVDTARTYLIGEVSDQARRLTEVTQQALNEAIKLCRLGNRTGDISEKIQKIVESAGFEVVRDLQGHGVGRKLQEAPAVPNFGKAGTGVKLTEGLTIAIEPITTTEETRIFIEDDNWTISCEKNISAVQIEDTVMITSGDPIILTR